jgi:hypothetical protein
VDILSPSPSVGGDFNHESIEGARTILKPKQDPGDISPQVYDKYLVGDGGSASGELENKPSDSYLPDVESSNSANTATLTNSTAYDFSSERVRPPRMPHQLQVQMHLVDSDSSDSREARILSLDSFCVFEKVKTLKVDNTKLLLDSAIDEVATLQQRLLEQNREIASQKMFLEQQARSISLLKMERDLLQAGVVGSRRMGESQAKNARTLLDQLFASCNTWSQQLSEQVSQRFVCAAY